jgi:hypothetical protein
MRRPQWYPTRSDAMGVLFVVLVVGVIGSVSAPKFRSCLQG